MTTEKLHHLCLVKFTGNDAASFLQGQLTNDIEKLDGIWHYSGYCNPKGRLLALFQVWQSNDTLYALLHSSLVEPTLKRLKMYILRCDVAIEIVENAAIVGAFSVKTLTELNPQINVSTASNRENNVWCEHNTFVLRVNDRFIYIDSNGLNKTFSNAQIWLQQDIDQGLPQISESSIELFIPQMLNLDTLDGISFKKGCYTGQEIVARMHYLGKLKQRMFVCELNQTNLPLTAGQKIYADDGQTKSVGNLVSALTGNGDSYNKVLAVLRLDTIDQILYLNSQTTLRAVDHQPYPLNN